MKLNFGCGSNRLDGWQNYDAETDITKPLPFTSASAAFILAEHVVEHIEYNEAIAFFRECRRVLRPGGVCRIAVPSITQVWRSATPDYIAFVFERGWAETPDMRGAINALLTCHGHRAPWDAALLQVSLFVAGFEQVCVLNPGESGHEELRGVEGHGRVIGDKFNKIETVVCEGN